LAFNTKAQEYTVIDEVVAVIGSEIVLRSDIEKQVIQYKNQGTMIFEETRCRITEDLLFSKLLLNQAKLDSVEVSEQQVEAELDRRIKYFVSQIGSERALEEYYKKSMEEIKSELRSNLRDQMVIQQMQGSVTSGVDITPSEVRKYFKELPEDSLPYINAKVEVAQIVILAPPSRQQVEDARNKLNELRERILNGEDFSTMAILYSEDPGTATKGGELGYVGKAEVDPAFAEAAFKLKGNEVSRIVKSEFGLHIIQLIDRDGDKVNVRHILIKPKIEGTEILRAKDICDSISHAILSSDTFTFAMAATRHTDDIEGKNSGGLMVNPQTGSSYFEFDQLDPNVYIAIEHLEKGDMSGPSAYATRDGKKGYSFYYVLDRIDAHTANMTLDYQMIQEVALSAKQQDVVEKWIDKKLASTYTKIDPDLLKCNFENNWSKVN
jgi:peptidyl-prolyl cis-trans isomerase SurA